MEDDKKQITSRINWQLTGVIVWACAILSTISFHTIGNLKNQAIALSVAGKNITATALFEIIHVSDGIIIAALFVCLLLLAAAEWRARSVSLLLRTARPIQVFILLTALAAWLGHSYLFPGVLLGGDTGTHVARFLEMRRAFEDGNLAFWTNYEYLGSSLLGFTAPFVYLVGGALDYLINDAVVSAKVILFSSHIATAWVLYCYYRRLELSVAAALISALLFTGSFAHLHLFLYRGVFPQTFTIFFLILLFYSAEGLMRNPRHLSTDWVIFALATGGLIVNHQPHALFAAAYLLVFGIASITVGRWQLAGSWPLVTAGGAGTVISVAAVIPVIVEASWTMIAPESGFFGLHLPSWERLAHLVTWRNTRTTWGIDYWAYLGTMLVGLAVYGGWAAISGRLGESKRRLALSAAPCLVLTFFLFNPVVRDIIFLLFFATLFAICGVEKVMQLGDRIRSLPAAMFVLVMLDLSSTSVQPLGRIDKQFMIDAGTYLEKTAPNERVMEVDIDRDGLLTADIGPNSSPISYYSTVQRIAGHHNMAATLVHNYAETTVKWAERDLRDQQRLSSASSTLLGMLNVTRIICNTWKENGCPTNLQGGVDEPPLGEIVKIPDASPVVFSRNLALLPPTEGLDKPMLWDTNFLHANPQITATDEFLSRFLQTGQFDMRTHIAAALPVRSLPNGFDNAAEPAAWHPVLRAYTVHLQSVSLTIDSDAPGFVQIAHPWFPSNEIRNNGKIVQPLEGSLSLIVMPITSGQNVIDIIPTVTPIRKITAIISLATFLMVLGLWAYSLMRTRRSGRSFAAS